MNVFAVIYRILLAPLFSQDFCLDLFEPSGHGKRRKRAVEANVEVLGEFLPKVERLIKRYNDSTPYTKFKENIEYTVMMPDGKLHIFNSLITEKLDRSGFVIEISLSGLNSLFLYNYMISSVLSCRQSLNYLFGSLRKKFSDP